MRSTSPSGPLAVTTEQPTRSSAQYSSASSGGASARAMRSSRPRSAVMASRSLATSRRRIGAASVPLRPTIFPTPTSAPTASAGGSGSITWNEPSSPWGFPTLPTTTSAPESVNDVDEHAALLAHRCRLDHGPQGVGGAAAAADDLAVVVLGDCELEHDRAVVLLELLDLDPVRLVDQRPGQLLQQLLGRAGHRGVPLGDALDLQELAHLVGRLGALGEPVAHALL